MHWGEPYREKHRAIYRECWRVLQPGGIFVLNVSDHIRNKQIIPVVAFHGQTLIALGFILKRIIPIPTQRLRYGQNAESRVDHEAILVFEKPTTAGEPVGI